VLDRFARNQYGHHALKAHFQKLGIALRAVAPPIDDGATTKLMDGVTEWRWAFERQSSWDGESCD
jgi:hypothetical protein